MSTDSKADRGGSRRRSVAPPPPLATAAIIALVGLPPLLIGTVHLPTMMIVGALVVATAGLGLHLARLRHERAPLSPWMLAATLLGVASLIQLLPLPSSLLALLSPEAFEGRRALSATGLTGVSTGGPISLDPARTALAAYRWLTLGVAALGISALLGALRRQRGELAQLVARPLAIVGALEVLIGLAQMLFSKPGLIYGVFESTRSASNLTAGSFINANHGAAFLAMATLAGVGLAVERRGARRGLWAGVATLCATGALLTASRGGIAALILSGAAFLLHVGVRAVWTGDTRRDSRLSVRLLPWAAVALLPLGLALSFVSQMALGDRFAWELQSSTSLETLGAEAKVQMIHTGTEMIGAFWKVGIGADSFGAVAPGWLPDPLAARTSFVESDPIEVLLNFGLPIGGLAIALVLLGWWRSAGPGQTRRRRAPDDAAKRASSSPVATRDARGGDKKRRSAASRSASLNPVGLGLLYGLAAFAISSAVSFNVEILGLALPALAMGEALLAERRRAEVTSLRPAAAAALTVALLISALGALGLHATWRHAAERAPQWLALTQAADAQEVGETLAMTPLDGHAVGLGALTMSLDPTRDGVSRPLCEHAVALAPADPFGHLACARVYGRAQELPRSARAYHAAMTGLKPVPKGFVGELLRTLPEARLLADALPPRRDAMETVMKVLLKERPMLALDVATELQAKHPQVAAAHIFAVRAALSVQQPLLAEMYARHMTDAFPDEVRSYLELSSALLQQKRRVEAIGVLSAGVERLPDSPRLRLKRAEVILDLPLNNPVKDADALLKADLEHLRVSSIRTLAQRARFFHLSGRRWERLGRPDRAEVDFKRAAALKTQVKSRPQPATANP